MTFSQPQMTKLLITVLIFTIVSLPSTYQLTGRLSPVPLDRNMHIVLHALVFAGLMSLAMSSKLA